MAEWVITVGTGRAGEPICGMSAITSRIPAERNSSGAGQSHILLVMRQQDDVRVRWLGHLLVPYSSVRATDRSNSPKGPETDPDLIRQQ